MRRGGDGSTCAEGCTDPTACNLIRPRLWTTARAKNLTGWRGGGPGIVAPACDCDGNVIDE